MLATAKTSQASARPLSAPAPMSIDIKTEEDDEIQFQSASGPSTIQISRSEGSQKRDRDQRSQAPQPDTPTRQIDLLAISDEQAARLPLHLRNARARAAAQSTPAPTGNQNQIVCAPVRQQSYPQGTISSSARYSPYPLMMPLRALNRDGTPKTSEGTRGAVTWVDIREARAAIRKLDEVFAPSLAEHLDPVPMSQQIAPRPQSQPRPQPQPQGPTPNPKPASSSSDGRNLLFIPPRAKSSGPSPARPVRRREEQG